MSYPVILTSDPNPVRGNSPPLLALIALLCAIAAWFYLWPARRAFLNVEIDTNEGWNAYFADAAMGRMALYPSADRLITNNYPPLSFYVVGGVGRLIGDPVLAGRLLSLAAVLGIAAAIALMVRRLGGNRAGALIAAAFFVVIMSRFCERYVGMDDPQLLAQAIMTFAFAGFIAACRRDRGYLAPILIMAAAGFIKHNIIAMPLTAFIWLSFRRPREAVRCFSAAAALIAAGIVICVHSFGRDFLVNVLSSRQFSWMRALYGLRELKCLYIALAVAMFGAWHNRRDPGVQLCSLFIGIALLSYFLQKTGAGVDANSAFDLVIAASAAVGMAFTHSPRLSRVEAARFAILVALIIPTLPWKSFKASRPLRIVFDPTFKTEIAIREKAMADTIARVKAAPGNVICTNLACYRAGKPFAVDKFNVRQRIITGALPDDTLKSRIASGELTLVEADPRADWDNPLVAKPSPP